MSHRGRLLAEETKEEREREREKDWESDEEGCAKEIVKGPFWPRCYGGSEGSEDVVAEGAKNEISASVERNRLRLLSSREITIFALDFVKDVPFRWT